MVTSIENTYTKLTVPQLKAICKERKITGYSKLGRAALLEKLASPLEATAPITTTKLDSGLSSKLEGTSGVLSSHKTGTKSGTANAARSTATDLLRSKEGVSFAKAVPRKDATSGRPPIIVAVRQTKDVSQNEDLHVPAGAHGVSSQQASLSLQAQSGPHSTARDESTLMPPPAGIPMHHGLAENVTAHQHSPSKRAAGPSVTPSANLKKPRFSYPKPMKPPLVLPADPYYPKIELHSPLSYPPTPDKENLTRAVPNTVTNLGNAGKRFKPLVTKKISSISTDHMPSNVSQAICSASNSAVYKNVQLSRFVEPPLRQEPSSTYLEFSPTPSVPTLVPISLPPPIQQRKRVHRWAVILSQIEQESLLQCALVCKTFRYAIYLSAQDRLKRKFEGKRTSSVLDQYPVATTNFWPYLRARQKEKSYRKRIFLKSFLAEALVKRDAYLPDKVITDELWGSPHDEKQITIALRFILTIFWFAISLGGSKSEAWLQVTVVSVEEIIPGEIWSVTFLPFSEDGAHSTKPSIVYVLETTCEVIGHCTELEHSGKDLPAISCSMPLRADWSSYVHYRLHPSNFVPSSLLSQLKWANYEEYDRGLSRHWLARINIEGKECKDKRLIAERYIFACVVANSVSGKWMSIADMAQQSAGLPDMRGPSATNRAQTPGTVNLYLSAHHHVESIHFTTSTGMPLHPALAIVQTPGREYFILKDNGMEVGCEEDGVAILWMEILGCDNKGLQA